jgi:hypothetical protein
MRSALGCLWETGAGAGRETIRRHQRERHDSPSSMTARLADKDEAAGPVPCSPGTACRNEKCHGEEGQLKQSVTSPLMIKFGMS